jgi:hypothetical protein
MSDTGELERILDEVLAANAKSVEEFRAGKEKAFNALVGQAMKATKGKANPAAGQRTAEEEARLTRARTPDRTRRPPQFEAAFDAAFEPGLGVDTSTAAAPGPAQAARRGAGPQLLQAQPARRRTARLTRIDLDLLVLDQHALRVGRRRWRRAAASAWPAAACPCRTPARRSAACVPGPAPSGAARSRASPLLMSSSAASRALRWAASLG